MHLGGNALRTGRSSPRSADAEHLVDRPRAVPLNRGHPNELRPRKAKTPETRCFAKSVRGTAAAGWWVREALWAACCSSTSAGMAFAETMYRSYSLCTA